jgi:uncharacterized SAM-binding protein YcdF (DUF218 family)
VNVVVALAKAFVVQGSAWFLIGAASLCALLLSFARTRAAGRWLLVVTVALYWAMSVPFVAHALQLAQRSRFADAPAAHLPREPLPIVVLGNGLGGYAAVGARFEVPLGQTAMNTIFAVDRFRQTPNSTIIASGGVQPGIDGGASEAVVIRDGLVRNGVPVDRIVLESGSVNTHEQAIDVSGILKARGDSRCVVVTSPQQMGRAAELFRREGITVFPLPAGALLWAPSATDHWWSWVLPSSEARAVSRDVFYEWMAWPYYRVRGWVS